jgi:hypothetical protein
MHASNKWVVKITYRVGHSSFSETHEWDDLKGFLNMLETGPARAYIRNIRIQYIPGEAELALLLDSPFMRNLTAAFAQGRGAQKQVRPPASG